MLHMLLKRVDKLVYEQKRKIDFPVMMYFNLKTKNTSSPLCWLLYRAGPTSRILLLHSSLSLTVPPSTTHASITFIHFS